MSHNQQKLIIPYDQPCYLWPWHLLPILLSSSSLYSARKGPNIINLMVGFLIGVQGSELRFIILHLHYFLTTFYLNFTACDIIKSLNITATFSCQFKEIIDQLL